MSRDVLCVSFTASIAMLVASVTVPPAGAGQAESQATRRGTAPATQGQADQNNAQTEQARRGSERLSSGQEGQWKNPDHCFATCVALANQEEIALAEIAEQKASNEDVKKFAEMMQKDHQDFLTKLQRFAPEAARPGYLGSADGRGTAASRAGATKEGGAIRQTAGEEEATRGENRAQTAAGTHPDNSQGTMNAMQIEREIAQQCLMSSKQKLNAKTGADFDKCYIHQMVAKHEAMKDKLTVFQRHGSKELDDLLAAGLKTTEHHLAEAERISKELDHSTSSSGKTRATTDEKRENK